MSVDPSQSTQQRSHLSQPTTKAPSAVQETTRTMPQHTSTSSQVMVRQTSSVEEVSTSANSEHSDLFPITISERGKPECLMINLKQIYQGECEFSIEEIRAKQSRYSISSGKRSSHLSAHPVASYQQPPSIPPPQTSLISSPPLSPLSPLSPPHTAAPQPVRPLRMDDSDGERQNLGLRRRLTSSPTLHTRYASEEMNKIFSDRSRDRRSLESQGSIEEGQSEDDTRSRTYSDRHSFPSLQLDPSSRAFLENEIQGEFDDIDDEQDGQTDVFLRRLERGYASTITQDIEAMKRRRLEEGRFEHLGQSVSSNGRLSLRSNKRSSSRFDPNHTRDLSDITIAIRQRQEPVGAEVSRSGNGQGRHSGGGSYTTEPEPHNRSDSLVRLSIESSTSSTRPRAPRALHDEPDQLDVENVPMLEDEAPPAYLDHDEPL